MAENRDSIAQSDNLDKPKASVLCSASSSAMACDIAQPGDTSEDAIMVKEEIEGSNSDNSIISKETCLRCYEYSASMKCPYCDQGHFCRLECVSATVHACKVPASITDLHESIVSDEFPQKEAVGELFFSACRTQRDWSRLLGMYQIIYRDFGVSMAQLTDWMRAGHIYDNVVRLFNKSHTHFHIRVGIAYFYWLSTHAYIFATEKKTEILDVKGYLARYDWDDNGGQEPSGLTDAERLKYAWETSEPFCTGY
jgi:hypothetical protein